MEQASNLKALKGISHGFYNAADSKNVVRPILLTQVHGADVIEVDVPRTDMPKADAWVTATCGLNLTIKTADCAPVLLADAVNGVIGAAHAGWKGAFQGVIENTVLAMLRLGAELPQIKAAVGPCLHLENFEVGADMKALFPVTEHIFFKAWDGKEHFDFGAYLMYRLHRAGLRSIEFIDADTYGNPAYHSYRRDKADPGRQYSVISLTHE